MYFPYLRGRQFELIAIRELLENNCLSNKIIPIIEPVRASSTLLKTLSMCCEKNHSLAFVINPKVGSFEQEYDEFKYKSELTDIINDDKILKTIIASDDITKRIRTISNIENSIVILDKIDYVDNYLLSVSGDNSAKFNLIPDERDFRRKIRDNRVIFNDVFKSEERNSDYSEEAHFFSSDHLYYAEDGYVGFGDYSIVGKKYIDGGFAPHCVVIHIVYFDEKNTLMIKHFSSDSNEDASNPANKFKEAVEKLLAWNETQKLNTIAMNQFKKLYEDGSYPGLGTLKKLSIMHHIELIGNFLDK